MNPTNMYYSNTSKMRITVDHAAHADEKLLFVTMVTAWQNLCPSLAYSQYLWFSKKGPVNEVNLPNTIQKEMRCSLLMDGQRGADSSLSAFTTFQYIPVPSTRKPRAPRARSSAGGESSPGDRATSTPTSTMERSFPDASSHTTIDWRCGFPYLPPLNTFTHAHHACILIELTPFPREPWYKARVMHAGGRWTFKRSEGMGTSPQRGGWCVTSRRLRTGRAGC